ncbi:hypothetical protein J4N45_14560 [Vibrio sp. SCSIO 43140]|uniref:hypothetical protein n=1 Tax=Vibrio sp. SCSIO 43140 TaxID=2819100 RepID=UPI00207584A2|nr:hypothetical protein [Vibrio sp. SCSIO 43140]USD58790.1 hypothetical protein J4N45_09625 [Vibrio sp. SCSIO 43140]USD59124.1 hypothetical protein J4N45_11330 [Vibrio sp. SCSIO 43140]USD59723.1 hypothetical protein J4N45_14560 [Vibrio sp. SCSIO 43140]
MNTLKLSAVTVMIVAGSLTGCAQRPLATIPTDTTVMIQTNTAPEAIYEAAVQCVLDNVNPPSSGQLFTYQSEKNSQLAFVYHDRAAYMLLGNPQSNEFKATIRINGKKGEIKSQGIQWFQTPSQYVTGGWQDPHMLHNQEYVDNMYSAVNDMKNKLNTCITQYASS